jgi:hypothetical protein
MKNKKRTQSGNRKSEIIMNIRPYKIWQATYLAMIVILISACANVNQSAKPARELTSCPPGEYLVCESRQPPSKGGAEEEIPQYEYCRCR